MSHFYTGLNNYLARALRTPPYLILFVTDVCWMRCRHCWFNEAWKGHKLDGAAPLSFEEYERLAESIGRIAFLSLTGGEAFVRDDIVDLTEMFRRKTKLARYQIPTSGYRTDRIVRLAEEALRRNPDTPFRVDVSLDGVGEVHDRVRRVQGGYERACATIEALGGLKRRYAHFDVGVITTLSRSNQDTVDEIGAVVERLNPDGEWMVNLTRGDTRDPTAVAVRPEVYRRAHALIARRVASGRYQGHRGHLTAGWLSAKNAARREVTLDIVEGRRRAAGCAAGALGGVIFSQGDVYPCELLDAPLGNLRDFDHDLARLWDGPRAREVRARIQQTRCQCTQECFLSVSMLIQPGVWPSIVRERIKLAHSRHPRPGA